MASMKILNGITRSGLIAGTVAVLICLTLTGFSVGAWRQLPGGPQLAFVRGNGMIDARVIGDLFLSDVQRHLTVQLTDIETVGEFSWSPDGQRLVFSGAGSNSELTILSLRDGSRRRLTMDSAIDYAPTWSPDGSQIAFLSNRDIQWGIYVIDVPQTDVLPQPRLVALADTRGSAVRWSPDSNYLAYVIFGYGIYGRSAGVYVAHADGSTVNQVFELEQYDQLALPVWSPDGRQIAFTYSDFDQGRWNVFIIDIVTGQQQTVENTVGIGRLHWLPDGRLRLVAQVGDAAYYEREPDQAKMERVSTAPYRMLQVVWSADGRWLAFNDRFNSAMDLFVVDTSTLPEHMTSFQLSATINMIETQAQWRPCITTSCAD